MKRASTIFLQAVIVLIGIGVLAFLLWEPHLEGRNAGASVFEIYFKDPFLMYAYAGSVAFFTALYQAFMLLGCIGKNKVFSPEAVEALRIIKYCALTIIGFLVGAEAYFILVMRGKEDNAGAVMLGLILIFISAVVATVAAVFQRTLQSAVDMKSENDLTV